MCYSNWSNSDVWITLYLQLFIPAEKKKKKTISLGFISIASGWL